VKTGDILGKVRRHGSRHPARTCTGLSVSTARASIRCHCWKFLLCHAETSVSDQDQFNMKDEDMKRFILYVRRTATGIGGRRHTMLNDIRHAFRLLIRSPDSRSSRA